MDDENQKSYGGNGVKEVAKVISTTEDACLAIAELMNAADLDSESMAYCCLKYIDNTIKSGKKRLATLMVMRDMAKAMKKDTKLFIEVDGKPIPLDEYISSQKDEGGDSLASKLKDVLGDS